METAVPVNYLGDFRPRCAFTCFFPVREVTMICFQPVEAGWVCIFVYEHKKGSSLALPCLYPLEGELAQQGPCDCWGRTSQSLDHRENKKSREFLDHPRREGGCTGTWNGNYDETRVCVLGWQAREFQETLL